MSEHINRIEAVIMQELKSLQKEINELPAGKEKAGKIKEFYRIEDTLNRLPAEPEAPAAPEPPAEPSAEAPAEPEKEPPEDAGKGI